MVCLHSDTTVKIDTKEGGECRRRGVKEMGNHLGMTKLVSNPGPWVYGMDALATCAIVPSNL